MVVGRIGQVPLGIPGHTGMGVLLQNDETNQPVPHELGQEKTKQDIP